MNQRISHITQKFGGLWHRLTDADTLIARQLAATSVVLLASMLIGVTPQMIWLPSLMLPPLMLAGLFLLLLAIYGLSRTRYYAVGVALLFAQSYVYAIYIIWLTNQPGYLALLGIPVFLATILIRNRASIIATMVVTAASLLLIGTVTWLLGFMLEEAYITITYVGIGGMVLLVLQWSHLSALEALGQSETRYRQMFENNRAIKLVIDPRTTAIREVNSAAAEFYGYPPEVLTTMYAKDINMLPEGEIRQRMTQIEANKGASLRFRHRLASGEIRHVMVYVSPVDMPEGRMLYVIVQDVTEQHHAELRYRALFSQSHDAIFMLNLDGTRIEINPRASELLGHDPEHAPTITYRETVKHDEQPHTEQILRRLNAGEQVPPYERTFRRRDGSLVYTEINATLVRDDDGTPLHIQSVARDITKRKLAELALRASEARLKSVVDSQFELICRVRRDMTLTFVNDAFCRFFGRDQQDLIGSSLLEMVRDNQREDIREAFSTMTENTGFREYEYAVTTRSGETRHLIWLMTPIRDKNGDEFQLVGSDITERRDALQQQFELALEQERTRLLTEFIQDAAHEFRTPLAVISSSMYLIQHTRSKERPATYWAEQVSGQVRRLTRLVDMLLTMARLESSSLQLDARIEMYGFMHSICDATRTAQREDAATLTCQGGPAARIMGNQKMLAEAFMHLLDNAYHFTPPDGAITVTITGSDYGVRIEICDTGCGIPHESLRYVFDTFWREDLMHSSPGFGLGLPIARRIIEQHHGQITLRSEADQGTCVSVLLPLAPGE